MFDKFYLVMSCFVLLSCLVVCGQKVCRKVTKKLSKMCQKLGKTQTWQDMTKSYQKWTRPCGAGPGGVCPALRGIPPTDPHPSRSAKTLVKYFVFAKKGEKC